jgi:peptidoglycan-associated lipoprotein
MKNLLTTTCLLSLVFLFSACRTRPDIDAGLNSGGEANGDYGIISNEAGMIGGATGLGELPQVVGGSFTPLPDALQIWKNIYFAHDQYGLNETSRQELNKLGLYLTSNTDYSIVIEGHCSLAGSEEYNRVLSEKRALAAKNYLSSMGVNPNRIDTIGYGEERPAVQGEGETAAAKNRRDVFILGTK